MKNFWQIDIKSKKGGTNTIGIQKGEYPDGEVNSALEKIRQFCAQKDIVMSSYGHGYGSVMIMMGDNIQKKYEYNPYGIDISMMLEYINECDELCARAKQGSSVNSFSHFHHPSSPHSKENPEPKRSPSPIG